MLARVTLPLHVLTSREAPAHNPHLPKGHACLQLRQDQQCTAARPQASRHGALARPPKAPAHLPLAGLRGCSRAALAHTNLWSACASPCRQTTAQHWSLTRPDIMLAREAMLLRSSLRLVYPELARLTKLATTISSSSSLLSPPRRWRLKMACKRRCSKGQRLWSGWHSQHRVFSACRQAMDAVSEDGLP